MGVCTLGKQQQTTQAGQTQPWGTWWNTTVLTTTPTLIPRAEIFSIRSTM